MKECDEPANIAGTLTPHGHRLPVRVYFEDTDFTGVVYHARYLHFFERARSDFLRLKGVDHTMLADGVFGESLFFAVKTIILDFHAAARIDDILEVETAIGEERGARLVMNQQIVRGGVKISSATVQVVLVNAEGKPRRMPAALVETLRK